MTSRWPLLALLVSLVLASGFVDFRLREFRDYAYATYIPKVIDGSYGAPAIYRVLVPFSNVWLERLTGYSAEAIWHITRLSWFVAAYLAIYFYLRTWFSVEIAAGGVSAVAATLPLTYTNSWAHPDSIPELALFSLGCLAIVRRSDWLFAVALVLAAFNRETSAFLVVTFFACRLGTSRVFPKTAIFAALWAVVYVGLRFWRGIQHYDYWQLDRNVEFLGLLPAGYDIYKRAYAWFVVALFGPVVALIAARWRRVPEIARRLTLSAIPFFTIAVAFSSIIETRIFLPLYPLLLPALLFCLVRAETTNKESRSGV